jgi:hypothetical protein
MVFNATFNNISVISLVVSFFGGENQSTLRKPQTCSKSLTNFRVNLVTNPVISREWGKDREVLIYDKWNSWSFVCLSVKLISLLCSFTSISFQQTLWVRIPLRRGVLDTTLCDKVCQWLTAGLVNEHVWLINFTLFWHKLRNIELLLFYMYSYQKLSGLASWLVSLQKIWKNI